MKINRRTMLKVSGGIVLGAFSLPELKAETRKPLLYIIVTDSYHDYKYVTRAWRVFWADRPNKHCDLQNYSYYRNVKKETFYDVGSLPGPVKKTIELNTTLLTSYDQFHCFRTYDVDSAGNINVIYDKDGSIW